MTWLIYSILINHGLDLNQLSVPIANPQPIVLLWQKPTCKGNNSCLGISDSSTELVYKDVIFPRTSLVNRPRGVTLTYLEISDSRTKLVYKDVISKY